MEYRSRAEFLGLPLVDVAVGAPVAGQYRRGVATGWVAVGDIACGVLLAVGGIAIGGVSLGGVSVGALALGGLALGVAGLGGLALGVVAMGGAAVAWYLAIGGLAVARFYAIGGAAVAEHVIGRRWSGFDSMPEIPHPPFRWPDGLVLVAIVVTLLLVVRVIRSARRR